MNTLHKYCEKIQLNRKFSKRVLIHGSAHIYHLFKEFATFTEGVNLLLEIIALPLTYSINRLGRNGILYTTDFSGI